MFEKRTATLSHGYLTGCIKQAIAKHGQAIAQACATMRRQAYAGDYISE
jgi:hypothetical protein